MIYRLIFVIILAQPLLFFGTEAGLGVTKIIYGALFFLWFFLWAMTKIVNVRPGETLFWHPVALPCLLVGVVLFIGVINGFIYGSLLVDIIRDLSPYLGYLALLPVLDSVREPRQAKKIIYFMIILGLPAYIIFQIGFVSAKQGFHTGLLGFAPYAKDYWEPVQAALWAVALGSQRFSGRLLSWTWILLYSLSPIFGGNRGPLLAYLAGVGTAFVASGKLAHKRASRYLLPVMFAVVVLAVALTSAGVVKLPFSKVTAQQYQTLTSKEEFIGDRSVQGRMREIRALMQAFYQNPVIGVGLGYEMKYYLDEVLIVKAWFKYHNGYAESLMKFGVVGTLIFAWFFYAAIKLAYRYISLGVSFFSQSIALGMVVWLISSLVFNGTAASIFADRGFALTMGVMMGLLPALANRHPYALETARARIDGLVPDMQLGTQRT